MKKIYNAQDINEANILKGLLEANNIHATVDGFYLQGGIGELAPTGFSAISVENTDEKAALELIKEYEANSSIAGLNSQDDIQHFNKNLVIIPIIIIAFFIATLLLAQ